MPNLISRLVTPWYPSSAIGLEKGSASIVSVERGRGNSCVVKRAATFSLAESIIRPGFDEPNLENPAQLASILGELAQTAGLLKQKRWSLSLPEATTRTLVLTMETQPQSNSELQDVLRWKMERGFGAPVDELSISREKLQKDSQGRDRYLAVAVRSSILSEYERVMESLGWRIGLVLPRHIGESQWLVRNGAVGDALLLSGSEEGFTAVVLRNGHPLIVRTVECSAQDCEDEFYRLLLFYRDRRAGGSDETGPTLTRLMVVGNGLTKERAGEIVSETTGREIQPLEAEDLGLMLPSRDFSFDAIAAPAGLAVLAL